MNPADTHAEILRLQVERYRSMTGTETANAAFDLSQTGRTIYRDGIRSRNPGATETEISKIVLRDIYDFVADES